jgi:8-oxo-dGTP pyrophosphatase MutT (NUDIX family)
MRMSPRPRPGDVFPLPPEIHPKEASVLILLFGNGKGDDLHFFLTRRTELVETHKGQISLPGGMQELGESPREAALREAKEELLIESDGIEVFPEPLTQIYIPVSGFRITPYVAYSPSRPIVHASPDEVVEVIEAPLEWIYDGAHVAEEDWDLQRFRAVVPFFAINGHKVWGATAMILSEFGEMLKQTKKKNEGV